MPEDNVIWVHWKGRKTGPYTNTEIDALIARREISSLHRLELSGAMQSVRDYVATKAEAARRQEEAQAAKPRFRLVRDEAGSGPDHEPYDGGGASATYSEELGDRPTGKSGTFTDRLADDLARLQKLTFSPLAGFFSFDWLSHGNTRVLLAVALPPLAIFIFMEAGWRGGGLFWLFGVYFSVLWMILFGLVLRPAAGLIWKAVAAYLITVLFSMTIMLGVVDHIPIIGELRSGFGSSIFEQSHVLSRFLQMFVAVAVPEELCKLAVIAVMLLAFKNRLSPHDSLYLGLASGLGFGISEGISYQMNINMDASGGNPDIYHTYNVIRLTALPLLHALWAGIAAYFLGLAARFPKRSYGLVALALLVPACLHAAHNSLGGLLSLVPCTLSVLALMTYMRDGEKALDQI